jgi:hypothetical protein
MSPYPWLFGGWFGLYIEAAPDLKPSKYVSQRVCAAAQSEFAPLRD